ncbi:histone-like nucleoid-structuring protein Lsr2 [Pseudolysinimonas sp.]|uniref:histone-like nucleoid-structuring protein Lsr2 n=1 Tax=Pseudolysinimonas sp. TaxID=2680009 RepID=UPI003F81C58D
MAQKVVVQLVDDLDGTPIEDGAGSTVSFAVDGTNYEIDLSDDHASEFRDVLAPYLKAGRRVAGGTRRSASRGTSSSGSAAASEAAAMREWANAQGMKVSQRGRVGSDVVEAYRASH